MDEAHARFMERHRSATRWLIDKCKAGQMHQPQRPAALEAAFAEAEAEAERMRQGCAVRWPSAAFSRSAEQLP